MYLKPNLTSQPCFRDGHIYSLKKSSFVIHENLQGVFCYVFLLTNYFGK